MKLILHRRGIIQIMEISNKFFILFFVFLLGLPVGYSTITYQESADVNSEIPGADVPGARHIIFSNYSKPPGFLHSVLWQFKLGKSPTVNYTLDSSCVNAFSNLIQLRLYSNASGVGGIYESGASCWDESDWTLVNQSHGTESPGLVSSSPSRAYDGDYTTCILKQYNSGTWFRPTSPPIWGCMWEEAIFWNTTTPPSWSENSTNVTSFVSKDDDVQFNINWTSNDVNISNIFFSWNDTGIWLNVSNITINDKTSFNFSTNHTITAVTLNKPEPVHKKSDEPSMTQSEDITQLSEPVTIKSPEV